MFEVPTLPAMNPSAMLTSLSSRLKVSDEEREFRVRYVERTLPAAQAAIIVGLGLAAALCILDWLLISRQYAMSTIPLRVASTILPLAFALATSHVATARYVFPYVATAAVVLVGVSSIVVGASATRAGIHVAFWGTILATVSAYLVLGLRVQLSAVAGGSIFAAFLLLGLISGTPIQQTMYGALLLACTNAAGLYAGWQLERSARDAHALQSDLQRSEQTDRLTGVSDRRTFDRHLKSVWLQARRDGCGVAAVIVDLDYFRLYNDCYGHSAGDDCIRAVAEVLSRSVMRPLDMVARYDGAVFAIVLYDPSDDFVEDYVNDLCRRIYKLEIPHKGSDVAATVTVSIGAALIQPREGLSSEHVIKSADDALYEAKDRGRNRAVVYPSDWADTTGGRLPAMLL